jgi:threonylcarbamoyladenosine tRNA methylthiotransferase MtaB
MKFFIFTTGCRANQWDSHVIATRLEEKGLSQGLLGTSDLIIINACSLTGRAEADVRRFIQKARNENRQAKVALVGCHAQAYKERNFGADLVLGQEEKFDADNYWNATGLLVRSDRDLKMETSVVGAKRRERTRFFFKIQDGCDKFCSYCVVPFARGAPRSRPIDEVIATMADLESKGVKEVVLTGIDMATYRDPTSSQSLIDLLSILETEKTPVRIRLSSIDPEYVSDDFITLLARSKKIAPSIHLPVQSGSQEVLKRMGRRHNPDFVLSTVTKLIAGVDGIGIGMDIMVGFPGEDEKAFEETFSLVESLDVFYLHVFPFSPRTGTRAARLGNPVSESLKKERVRRLKTLDAQKRAVFGQHFVGKEVWVIPETKIYRNELMKGFSGNYLPIYLPYEKRLENSLVKVTIRGVQNGRLMGEKIERASVSSD